MSLLLIPKVTDQVYRSWFGILVVIRQRVEKISRFARNDKFSLAVIPDEERDRAERISHYLSIDAANLLG